MAYYDGNLIARIDQSKILGIQISKHFQLVKSVHAMNKWVDVHAMNEIRPFSNGDPMSELGRSEQVVENGRIVLGLLESVERDGAKSQRKLASELGIALGLVNAYLKRCVKKGLVKVGEAPARRYIYYLTPQGFAEKSKLTVEYLSYSFSFFREARADCTQVLDLARVRGARRIVLAGSSDLAEIVRICALECGLEIVAVADPQSTSSNLVGIPIVKSFDEIAGQFDAVVVTDLKNSVETFASAVARFSEARVYAPMLLGLGNRQSAAS